MKPRGQRFPDTCPSLPLHLLYAHSTQTCSFLEIRTLTGMTKCGASWKGDNVARQHDTRRCGTYRVRNKVSVAGENSAKIVDTDGKPPPKKIVSSRDGIFELNVKCYLRFDLPSTVWPVSKTTQVCFTVRRVKVQRSYPCSVSESQHHKRTKHKTEF